MAGEPPGDPDCPGEERLDAAANEALSDWRIGSLDSPVHAADMRSTAFTTDPEAVSANACSMSSKS